MHYRLVPTLAAALLIALAAPAGAQGAQPAAQKPAVASKPAAKAAKAAPKAKSKSKSKGKRLAPSAQKAVEEVTPIDDDPSIQISEEDLAVARQVYVGEIPCELGASVRVRAARRAGLFVVSTRGHRFLMHPVHSRTGAIRLEDARRGAMWLQLGNKSMLMSQKLGQRLADECQSPEQITMAEELKRNPRPSILEPMPHGDMHGSRPGTMPCCSPQPVAAPGAAVPGTATATTDAPVPAPAEAPAAATAPGTAAAAGAADAAAASPPPEAPAAQNN